VRKLSENLFMQNATWLVSRELAEAAGPWDEDLCYDQDGEYFARVVMASEGTRFAPEAKIFYRRSDSKRVSCIGRSVKKMESQLRSMKLHIQYLRSLEDSERVRKACLIYLQNWMNAFYRSEPAIEDELRNLAMQLNGQLEAPRLRWKYGWIELFFGYEVAGRVQTALPEIRNEMTLRWDKAMSWLESR
jgi:GT2 family glycosyltransferase